MFRNHRFSRLELMVGKQGLQAYRQKHVMVVGLGGVGSHCAETLARSAVGKITLVDHDEVCATNINRQIHATSETVGQKKAILMAERIQKINPLVEVLAITHHHHPDKGDEIFERATQWAGQAPDAVCDAIDTLIPKVDLLERCIQKGIPVISSMGSASRSDPSQIKILDISKTRVDPFAKAVRLKLKQRGITKGIPCVHSSEVPLDPEQIVLGTEWLCICPNIIKEFGACQHKRYMLGTTSFLPPMFGMWMASYWLRKWVEGVERNLVPEKEYIPTFSEMERAMRAAEWPSEA